MHIFEVKKCAQIDDIWKNATAISIYVSDNTNKTLAVGTNLKAFPRNLRSGLPLRRTGRSGENCPTSNLDLLMAVNNPNSFMKKGYSAQYDLF